MTFEEFKSIAFSFPEVQESLHFEKTSLRIKNKIFATYDFGMHSATLKLSEVDQDVFTKMNPGKIYPVPNKWGKQGWTIVELGTLEKDILKDALTCAYCTVAPKKLAVLVQRDL